MAVYGIDLGTTYCSVAYVENGKVLVVPLEGGGRTLASIVLLAQEGAGVRSVVGKRAREEYRRLIGVSDRPPEGVILVRGAKNYMAVRRDVPGGPPWVVGGHTLWSTDISAIILRALADIVRQTQGLPTIDGVVIAHPQRFRSREKLATAQAARLAGLEVRGLVTEPDAAAWAYGLHDGNTEHRHFMVFDFGGGTLDVTLMRRERTADGRVSIQAIDSYGVQLGGLAMDEKVRDRLLAKYVSLAGADFEGLSLDAVNEATRERLLEVAEQLKVELNQDLSAEVSPWERSRRKWIEPEFEAGVGDRVQLEVRLKELSAWISGEIDRAVACADEALRRANMQWSDLDRVLLTGGSSQLYALQVRMKERAPGKVQIVFDQAEHPLNPSTIVASGAAMYGASLANDRTAPKVEMRGVLPDSFSVRSYAADPSAPGGRKAILYDLVKAGTPTPFVGRGAFLMRGGSRVLPVEVFEGRTEAEATQVGTYRFEFDRDVPDGTVVNVELDVKANGVLVLRVRDTQSGAVREATLTEAGLYSDAEVDSRRAWLQNVRVEVDR